MDQEPTVDPLVVGLTRPPMMLGVPYMAFVLTGMVVVCAFIATKLLSTLLLALPVHAVLFLATARDARMLDVVRVAAGRCPPTRNRTLWGADAYAP